MPGREPGANYRRTRCRTPGEPVRMECGFTAMPKIFLQRDMKTGHGALRSMYSVFEPSTISMMRL
jgi:hypothetical protein